MKTVFLVALTLASALALAKGPVAGGVSPIDTTVRKNPLALAGQAHPAPLGLKGMQRISAPPALMEQYRQALPKATWFGRPESEVTLPAELRGLAETVQPLFDRNRSLAPEANAVLVLYDGSGPYGFVGEVYGRQLVNLIRHTNRPVYLQPVEQYVAGSVNKYAQTFYLGVLYDNPLPTAFKNDVLKTTHPVCWCGYNLWQIAWTADWTADNNTFVKKYGMRFQTVDAAKYVTVTYKGKSLAADPYGSGLGKVALSTNGKATTLAEAVRGNGKTAPYIVHGANLWYVADNPLADGSTWTTVARTLAFEDVLHDIVADGVGEDHPALIRIEDVHADSDPKMLRDIADFLKSENVPFVVCVIPHYRDPLGYWANGVMQDRTINDKPELVAALKYMESKGGEIIMHGLTHQYDDVQNPGSGVSGDDYEFFRLVNQNGQDVMYGPVYEDSPAWVNGRLDEGFNILAQAGFNPTGWNTPHYLASPVDYRAFAQRFDYSFCRGKTFATDAAGYLYMVEQEPPYPIVDDMGMYRFPETLGYVSTPDLGVLKALPQNMVNRSKKVNVVRDGWAGCFFHWFLPLSMLQDLVHGIKNQGFHFVAPRAYFANQNLP